jgi:hypothetical protein
LRSGDPDAEPSIRKGEMVVDGRRYQYAYGGTVAGDKQAQLEARKKVLEFMANL